MNIMNRRKPVLLSALILLALVTMGCAPLYTPPDYSKSFFPQPPEKKRLQLINIVKTDLDVRRPSLNEELFGGSVVFSFVKPFDVVVDDEGTAYISDSFASTIYMINLEKGTAGAFGIIGQWRSPKTLAFDTKNKLLGIVEGRELRILNTLNGKIAISLKGLSLKKPAGIAFDPDNRLIYVSDIKTHEIHQFNYKGEHLITFGGRGPDEKHLYFPGGLALDSDGFLYVVDTMHWKIKVFNKEGGFERSFGGHGNAPGMFGRPKGIAISRDGVVMVTDGDFNRVTFFTKMGAVLLNFGNTGKGSDQFTNPYGIDVDKNNRVYIADQTNRRVFIFQLYTDEYYAREFQKEVTATPDQTKDEDAPKPTVGGQQEDVKASVPAGSPQ